MNIQTESDLSIDFSLPLPAWLFDSEKEKSVEMTIGPLVSPRLSPLFAFQFPEFHYSSFSPRSKYRCCLSSTESYFSMEEAFIL